MHVLYGMIKKRYFIIVVCLFFTSCSNDKNIPDVSNIQVNLHVERFDKDFFSMDTINIDASFDALQKKYPSFLNDFLYSILALPSQRDSVILLSKKFLSDYAPVYKTAEKKFSSTNEIEKQVYSL